LFHRIRIQWPGIGTGQQNPAGQFEEDRLLDGVIKILMVQVKMGEMIGVER
jgi:hypothetical protein